MVAWGTVSMCMAAVTNGAGLVATRFFLGLAESVRAIDHQSSGDMVFQSRPNTNV